MGTAMGNNETFSWSISLGGTSAPPPPELFAVGKLSEFPLPDHTVLVRNPANGRTLRLPEEVASALTFCDAYRTLEEHTDELMKGSDGSPDRRRAIREVVKSVHDGGLTSSARSLCETLRPRQGKDAAASDPVVAVITCDRPRALARLLDSMAETCDFGHIHRCCIVDDSRSATATRQNRELAGRLASRTGCRVDYFGRQEASALQAYLANRLPYAEDSIRFLLDWEGWRDFISTGTARNYCQLLSAGRPLVVFDDDTVCRLYAPAFERAGPEFSLGRLQAQFFDDLSEQDPLRQQEDADPVRRHLQCLGLGIPEALGALGLERLEQDAFRYARPEAVAALHRNSRIRVTECGSVGDPGSIDYTWLGSLPEETLDILCGDERQASLAAAESRCWLGVNRPTLTHGANFSQVTGFDNRDFLPPYFPIERGQDRIFGDMAHFLYPDSVSLIYPWAVLHLRENHTVVRPGRMEDFNPGGDVGHLTGMPATQVEACAAAGLEARLDCLAASFAALSSASHDTIIDLCSEQRLRQKSWTLTQASKSLHRCRNAPRDWKSWLARAEKRAQERLLSTPALLQPDRPGKPGRGEIIDFWRDAWRRFGDSLVAWPALRRAAAEWMEEYRPSADQ
ncbi:MAG: hypothetical protein PVI46_04275 [Lysobacterales bacterium]|jgi:hypothetical protein